MSWDWKKRLQTEDSSPEELSPETAEAEESGQQGEHSEKYCHKSISIGDKNCGKVTVLIYQIHQCRQKGQPCWADEFAKEDCDHEDYRRKP